MLCERISSSYDNLSTNVQLYSRRKKRKIAEIDILAMRNGQIDIYEVKCSYRKTKAKKQLLRIRRLLPNISTLFFFCGESGTLERIL